jgi:antirestriction protein ArdC
VFWKFANDSSESQEYGAESGRSRLLFTRGYSVFNAAQVDGHTPKVDADTPMPERIAHAKAFFGAIGATVQHGGNQAATSGQNNFVTAPEISFNLAFTTTLALLIVQSSKSPVSIHVN